MPLDGGVDANGDCPIKRKEQSTGRQMPHSLLFEVSGILYRHTRMRARTHTHTGHKSKRESGGGRRQTVRESGRRNMGDRMGAHMVKELSVPEYQQSLLNYFYHYHYYLSL